MNPTAAFNPDLTRTWLAYLYWQCDGWVSIVSTTDWAGRTFPVGDLDPALTYITHLDRAGAQGIYARVSTLTHQPTKGRGKQTDAGHLPGLWADMDLHGPGHKVTATLPADQTECQTILTEAGLPEPTLWIHSGGGLYPWWLLNPPEPVTTPDTHARFAHLSDTWQAAIGAAANRLGRHYGTGVGDLARVLRIPGTVNRKEGLARPCLRVPGGTDERFTLDELLTHAQTARDILTTHTPVPKTPPPTTLPSLAGDRPGDHYNAQATWNDLLPRHGWRHAYTIGATAYWVRPGKTTPGISANTNYTGRDSLHVFSTDALPFDGDDWYSKFRAYALLEHHGDDTAAAKALREQGYGAETDETTPTRRRHRTTTGTADETDQLPPEPELTYPDPDDPDLDQFWLARPTLTRIRTTARAHLVSPWAVLGGLLATIATRIGPHVVLPPIIGGPASLNTFYALVGTSGAGKDTALTVATELLALSDDIPTHEVGTGQGIDSAYVTMTRAGPIQFCDSALFTATEIDTINAHATTIGATLMATLRKVYTGAALGARYADKTKRRPVKAHHYRAALIAGVQPARSKVILADHAAGTPQRWLWLPTNDPHAPTDITLHTQNGHKPFHVTPPGDIWTSYEWFRAHGATPNENDAAPTRPRIPMNVCATAHDTIITTRLARLHAPLTEAAEDLTGHHLLTRLKVAALLAIFDGGRSTIDDTDWALAGLVMAVSDHTRGICVTTLADTDRKTNAAQAFQQLDRDRIITDRTEQRVALALQRVLVRRGEWVPRAQLRRDLNQRDREYFDSALARLLAAGQVDREESERGEKYRVHGS